MKNKSFFIIEEIQKYLKCPALDLHLIDFSDKRHHSSLLNLLAQEVGCQPQDIKASWKTKINSFFVKAGWKTNSSFFFIKAGWKTNSRLFFLKAGWKNEISFFFVKTSWKNKISFFCVKADWKTKSVSFA